MPSLYFSMHGRGLADGGSLVAVVGEAEMAKACMI
jgi:hypothetical protein